MLGRRSLTCVAAAVALLCAAAPASADWNGDAKGDVLAVAGDGGLVMYRGNGAGRFTAPYPRIGTGWGSFTALLATDFSGDGRQDLLARADDGRLLQYRGDGKGGFASGAAEPIGSGWGGFTALIAPGHFSGDGRRDLLARRSDGALLLYRGDGDSGFSGAAQQIGSGWGQFTALLGPGDWSGDGKVDVIARGGDGTLFLYRGNGKGGWVTGKAEQIGTGWGGFTGLAAGGDFSGDGFPDILARAADGSLLLYRSNGSGRFFAPPYPKIGSGWQSLSSIVLLGQGRTPPPAPPAPPSAPLPDGRVRLNAGDHCVPPGGRLHVSLKVRKRKGAKRPRVRRVVFFVRNGPRRVDRKRPYSARLRLRRPAGSKGRVYARVYFRRAGSKQLRKKTVARRFVMCS